MIECCGKQRSSQFCPDCGKALKGELPLDSLLIYLRVNVKSYTTRAESFRTYYSDRSDAAEKLASAEAARAKFSAWADALAALIRPEDD